MPNNTIKTCPFCGEEPSMSQSYAGWFGLTCDSPTGCGAEGPYKETEALAIDAWNARVPVSE
jgi:Lar family restriction alleviation protein